jgi:hypothetical protein
MKAGNTFIKISVLGLSMLSGAFLANLNAQDNAKWNKSKERSNNKNTSRQKGGGMQRLHMLMSSLSEEDRNELIKLRKEDPRKFRELLQKKAREARQKKQERDKKLKDLVNSYKKAENKEEKSEILQRITEETEKEFKEKMDINLRRLEEAEKKVREFRNKYETRKKKAKEIIDQRVKDLIRDPALKW